MAQFESRSSEQHTFARGAQTSVDLSRSAQDLFQPNSSFSRNEQLPLGLDFTAGRDIYASSDSVIAYKKDEFNWTDLLKWTPHDGDNPSLHQILNDCKTPFIDAYERSKKSKDGEPGKSKTLEEIVDRLKDCPWADKIHVKFDSKALNPEYDPVHNTITINPKDSIEAQIELFAHEAYHSTHQFLNKMYGGILLDKDTFTNTLLWGEVGSMIAEAKIQDELKLATDKPTFYFRKADGTEDHIVINDYLNEPGGIKKLFDFLKTAQPARLNQKPYGIHYQDYYQDYAENFTQNGPDALKMIKQWVNIGHKAEDI